MDLKKKNEMTARTFAEKLSGGKCKYKDNWKIRKITQECYVQNMVIHVSWSVYNEI